MANFAKFESSVGFDRVREQILALCSMRRAQQMLSGEGFSTSRRESEHRLSLTDEVGRLLSMEQEFPREEFSDIAEIVRKIEIEGTFLDTGEVVTLTRALRSAGEVSSFVMSRDVVAYPTVRALSQRVASFVHIVAEADRIIDNFGQVRDNASPELHDIRREIRSREGQVSKRLHQVLNAAKSAGIVDADAMISIREGRAVIPVAAGNKRKLQGFIHDESATGKTFYIEPVEVVELNNELKELEYAERREIVRILSRFTDMLRPEVEAIASAEEYLATIDMLRAKARWAAENGAVKPILSTDGRLLLRTARHSLLEQTLRAQGKKIVPLDMELDSHKRIMVISGPNAGGKSVCLKTAGLVQYLFQCGYLVPVAENSELPIFERMYIDIGDEQSIDNDLSTYSSHLTNMKDMLAGASERTMVLIDEFGSGTEPVIGGAIAEAILERLVERKCYGVITTHYSNIKYYAANTDGISNGAMMFDVQNIRPLFKLETGKPGSSFAIEIARKIGLPEQIIRSASEKVGPDHINIEKQLREIARDKRYWEQKRDRIRIADKKVDELEQRYKEQLERIRSERNEIIGKAKQEAKELVKEANRQIENTIKTIRESQAERDMTRLARQELQEFRDAVESDAMDAERDEKVAREMERLERRRARRAERKNGAAAEQSQTLPEPPKPKTVEVGSKVRIEGQDMVGVVQSMKGKKAQVAFGHILTTVDKERLVVVSNAEYREATRPVTPRTVIATEISERRLNFSRTVDVRGMRVVEALDKVQDLVDDALMVGVDTITVLHGKGTGALKEEIRAYLRTIPHIGSVRDEHEDMGGAGITVITFK